MIRKKEDQPWIILMNFLFLAALLQAFQANFEFNRHENKEVATEQQRNATQSIGKINVNWKVSSGKDISHFLLQWHSSKDLHIQQKLVPSNETSATIGKRTNSFFHHLCYRMLF